MRSTREDTGAAALILVGLLLPACWNSSADVEIVQTRTTARAARPALAGATPQERFGRAPVRPDSFEPAGEPEVPLDWVTPEGWEDLGRSGMRLVNLSPGEGAECYLSILPGDGGGRAANVNRWRSQMGLPPLAQAEVDGLQLRPLIGRPATYVELSGTFTNMQGETWSGHKMIGLILTMPEFTLFVKMTGPAQLLDAELGRFDQLCSSIEVVTGGAAPDDPDPAPSARPGELAFTAPAGWREGPARAMRLVTLEVGAETECYVTELGGDGGGLALNVERWLGQLGQPAPTEAELAAMPRIPVMGGEGVLVEGDGTFRGMDGAAREGYALLGIVQQREETTLFVKMVGPAAEVAAGRGEFLEFVSSLREEQP